MWGLQGPHRHAQGAAQEGALHLLPLHAQGGEGGVAPVALKVRDEVLDHRRRDDVPDVLRILMLQACTISITLVIFRESPQSRPDESDPTRNHAEENNMHCGTCLQVRHACAGTYRLVLQACTVSITLVTFGERLSSTDASDPP